ncbi:NAD(P)-binding protein [Phlegmacium glaucopus]|nr:NAD(P)-binding protein [Phlegmacium glaucopus]
MVDTPAVQRAWTVIQRGKPANALVLRSDWPVPQKLEKGEVLIKVQAGALNPAGWKLMRLVPNLFAKRPHVAEHDLSGIIVDSNGTEFSNGDNVYGWIPVDVQFKTRQGALAEYIRGPADYFVHRPSNITPVEAAGITLAALTSYQALHHIAKVEPEQTVFINGGSSATGVFAIQIAKAKGAKVVATASAKNEQVIRNLGADEFIDYTQEPLHEYLAQHIPDSKYHVIYDAVGLTDPSLFTWCEKYLAPDGIFISNNPFPKDVSMSELWQGVKSLLAMFVPASLGGVNRRYSVVSTKQSNEDMRAIQELLERGAIKPVVDSTYEFEDALEAFDRILTSRAVGKVVVKIDPTCN